MVSERVRHHLALIAGRISDGDEGSVEPLLNAWDSIRIALDDAEDLCVCVELADALEEWNKVFGTAESDGFVRSFVFLVGVAQEYEHKHGTEPARRMLRNLVQLMGETATVETVQIMERKEVES
jgi:hypothetical protein